MRLPNAERADLGDKLEQYILNPNHRHGRHKARLFESALGITLANRERLANAILTAALNSDEAEARGDNGHGEVYVLRFSLQAAAGAATILSAWIVRPWRRFSTPDHVLYTLTR